jgi:uncharacterized protein (UPF0332 family)
MVCKSCKETLTKHESVLGGYVCKHCGKFTPREVDTSLESDYGESCEKQKNLATHFRRFLDNIW